MSKGINCVTNESLHNILQYDGVLGWATEGYSASPPLDALHHSLGYVFMLNAWQVVCGHQAVGLCTPMCTWAGYSWRRYSSTSALMAVSLLSVVRRRPSAVRSETSALASKAVACALGLQKTSRCSISRAAVSPAGRRGERSPRQVKVAQGMLVYCGTLQHSSQCELMS